MENEKIKKLIQTACNEVIEDHVDICPCGLTYKLSDGDLQVAIDYTVGGQDKSVNEASIIRAIIEVGNLDEDEAKHLCSNLYINKSFMEYFVAVYKAGMGST